MAISVVQTKVSTSPSFSLNSATTAGNCVIATIAGVGSVSAPSISGITLGGGADHFAQIVADANAFSPSTFIWADPNCAGGKTSIVVTLGGGWTADGFVAYEVSGLLTSAISDKTNHSAGSSSTFTSNASGTTTVANEFWVGVADTGGSPGNPAGWTNTNSGSGFDVTGYQIVSSTGSATYTASCTNAAWSACVATLKGAVTAAAATPLGRPVQARRPLFPLLRGRTSGSRGAAVRNPTSGPAFRQATQPAQARLPRPQFFPRGRTSGNPGGPVQNPPSQGPVFRQAVRAVRAVIPQTFSKGRTSGNPGGPVRNPSQGPPFEQATTPIRAPVPQTFSKGRVGSNKGGPVSNPRSGPPFRPAVQAVRAKLPQRQFLPRGRILSNKGGPVRNPPGPALIVSIASKAGTDDYGNTFPQGLQATEGVIEGPTIIGSNAFYYSSTPAFGNLIASITGSAGTDSFGNAYVEGVASYTLSSGIYFACRLDTGTAGFFASPGGAGGPYTEFGSIGFSFAGSTGHLIISSTDGVSAQFGSQDFMIPQAGVSGSIATLPDDTNSGTTWVSGERAFMNNQWVANVNNNFAVIISALQAAGIIT